MYEDTLLGAFVALVYCLLGYSSSEEPFNAKKFLRTFMVALFIAFGFDISFEEVDIYVSMFTPTMLTILFNKIVDTFRTKM